jgi:hypothetical protein
MITLLILAQVAAITCGSPNWPVKTLTDSTAYLVSPHGEVDTITVKALGLIPKAPSSYTRRINVPSKTIYRVTARIGEIRNEKDDGDIHVILHDPDSAQYHFVAEIPNPACVKDLPWLAELYVSARAEVKLAGVGATITVEGVGFFDRDHGQLGQGPNGLELHPLLLVLPGKQ